MSGLPTRSAFVNSFRVGGTIVAYEADSLDLTERSGWAVTVVAVARLETDSGCGAALSAQLRPWLTGAMTHVLTISSEIVTGYRLIPLLPTDEIVRAAE